MSKDKSLQDIPVQVESLYAASEKIYPREIKGPFQTMRNACVVLLLGIYYLFPWIDWGGRQAVLFDLPARQFHIFGLTMWPQDFIFLSLLLLLAGLSLFFFTALAGRVWCGFACPQTVWTEAFLWMERWVEGSRAKQMKLSKAPWTFDKIRKRSLKQFLWITFSLLTGLTFVGYFVPIKQLFPDFFSLQISGWALFWVVFYGFATYGNAGFMREQVCQYMCPYARFQSAMFDKDTLIVAYNEKRGEPRERGKRRKQEAEAPKGDCIDCGMCVQVCPTGIDIRDGLQYECIACAACIDACDEVMEKVGLPPKLIRYSSENNDEQGGGDFDIKKTIFRPRILIYGTILGLIFAGFVTALFMRSSFQVDVIRDRGGLYRIVESGAIENGYQIRLMNKSQQAQQYTVAVQGLEGLVVKWNKNAGEGTISREVPANGIGNLSLIVSHPDQQKVGRAKRIKLIFTEMSGDKKASVEEDTRFWGPSN